MLRFKKRIILFFLFNSIAIILTLSCSHKQVVTRQDAVEDLVDNGIIVNLDSDEEALVKLLGKPLRVEVKNIENAYYDFDDASIHYYYPGLEIIYYHHKHPEKGWKKISRIEVTNNDYHLKYAIRIGMHISEIYKQFGSTHFPIWVEEGFKYIGYESTQSEHEQILFIMKDDILNKFIWSNWP